MTAVFSEKEKKEAFATKKRLLAFWILSLLVFLAVIITMMVINAVQVNRDGDRTLQTPFLITTIVL